MKPFEYERATDVAGAVALLADRPGAVVIAGGTNLVDHMKLGIANPEVVVDVSRLPLDRINDAFKLMKEGKAIRKVIYVPGKIVNFVVG